VDCYLGHNFTILAKDLDRIVGVLQWYLKEDPTAGIVEFEEYHVRAEYRGKGIGSRLVDYAIQSVKAYFRALGLQPRRIFLFVGSENRAARAVFEKFGFESVGEAQGLFFENEPLLIYCLRLDQLDRSSSARTGK
jgi:ribosomal protein S18 acetylase RimI-like enzyme